ncbi:MAG: hypothetical protein R3F17_08245 [Planctomycetota bacterium]
MKEQSAKPKLQGETLGLALCVIGVVPTVLVLVALFKGQVPGETQVHGIRAVALRLVGAFGYFPSLLAFGGVSVIGAMLFLGSNLREPFRHVLGLVGCSLGLAAALAAVVPGGGGLIGQALGGALAKGVGAWAGVAIGLLIAGATAAFTWWSGHLPLPKKVGGGATLSSAITELDRDGVSNAETHALAPDASTLRYMEELWSLNKTQVQTVPLPPSPYPEDVRLKGEIPKGAAPLKAEAKAKAAPTESLPTDAQPAPKKADASVDKNHRWNRPGKGKGPVAQPAGANLGTPKPAHAKADVPFGAGVEEGRADDPFGLKNAEEQALADLIGLDSAHATQPKVRKLPPGTKPLDMGPAPEVEGAAVRSRAPRPVWEQDDEPAAPAPIARVEPSEPSAVEVVVEAADELEVDEVAEQEETIELVMDVEPEAEEAAAEAAIAEPAEEALMRKMERDWLAAWEGRESSAAASARPAASEQTAPAMQIQAQAGVDEDADSHARSVTRVTFSKVPVETQEAAPSLLPSIREELEAEGPWASDLFAPEEAAEQAVPGAVVAPQPEEVVAEGWDDDEDEIEDDGFDDEDEYEEEDDDFEEDDEESEDEDYDDEDAEYEDEETGELVEEDEEELEEEEGEYEDEEESEYEEEDGELEEEEEDEETGELEEDEEAEYEEEDEEYEEEEEGEYEDDEESEYDEEDEEEEEDDEEEGEYEESDEEELEEDVVTAGYDDDEDEDEDDEDEDEDEDDEEYEDDDEDYDEEDEDYGVDGDEDEDYELSEEAEVEAPEEVLAEVAATPSWPSWRTWSSLSRCRPAGPTALGAGPGRGRTWSRPPALS